MAALRSLRFGPLAALAAAAGCAHLPVPASPSAERTAGLAARAEQLARDLDEIPAFSPERRAAEPALVALAMRIAAQLGGGAVQPEALVSAAEVAPFSLADLQAPPAPLALPPAESGPWAVEFGQFETVDLARSLWAEIVAAAPDAARGLIARTAVVRDGVSLRAGPLDEKPAAVELCKAFDAAGIACTTSKFTGASLSGAGQ